ncbi:MAG: glycosyltransferase [Candidatus Omnitrophica bacterium]|nr:glycosyltransferase [Candidatus Omnitrophota bacterium]
MTQQPFISIIIPVLNAQRYIGPCLEALLAQDYPKDKFEIIVLDNGSLDKTVDIIKKYPVKFVVKTRGTISALRNWGVKQARGNIFSFIDADCLAPSGWLSCASSLLQLDNVGAVGCWYVLPESTTIIERTWDMITDLRRQQTGPIDWVPSGDLTISKKVFEQIGGFDEYLMTDEDVDICRRIIKTGREVYSHPSLAVKHLGNPKTLKQFFFKEKWRGEGVVQGFFRKLPQMELNKALIFGAISLFFVLGVLGGMVLWITKGTASVVIISILGLLVIPFLMTIKILLQRQEWDKFFILLLLFVVYGLARAASILNGKVWKITLKGPRHAYK